MQPHTSQYAKIKEYCIRSFVAAGMRVLDAHANMAIGLYVMHKIYWHESSKTWSVTRSDIQQAAELDIPLTCYER